jgi:hypothetical protein
MVVTVVERGKSGRLSLCKQYSSDVGIFTRLYMTQGCCRCGHGEDMMACGVSGDHGVGPLPRWCSESEGEGCDWLSQVGLDDRQQCMKRAGTRRREACLGGTAHSTQHTMARTRQVSYRVGGLPGFMAAMTKTDSVPVPAVPALAGR